MPITLYQVNQRHFVRKARPRLRTLKQTRCIDEVENHVRFYDGVLFELRKFSFLIGWGSA